MPPRRSGAFLVLLLPLSFACGGAESASSDPAAEGGEGLTGLPDTGSEASGAAGGSSTTEDATADLAEPMQAILAAHDRARAEHCAPPLAWSPELAAVAEAWAAELVDRGCVLEHSRSAHGENLFAATSGARTPADVVGVWVDERDGYRFVPGGFSMQTGHFTQVVWKDTQRVGCAMTTCNGLDLWVCNYDPPGNVQGQYREQVLPTGCSD